VSFTQSSSGWAVGGNWNYTLQSSPVTQSVASQIVALINGGLRLGSSPSLHVEGAYNLDPTAALTSVIITAHNDTFNPQTDLAGAVAHGVWDGIWGTLKQSFGGSLGCH
jgi:hypothetical protein